MKRIQIVLLAAFSVSQAAPLLACSQCRPLVQSGVYNQNFAANLSVLLLPLALLCAIGFGLHHCDAMAAKWRQLKGANDG